MTATGLHRILVANDSRHGLALALARAARLGSPAAQLLVVETIYDPRAAEPAEAFVETFVETVAENPDESQAPRPGQADAARDHEWRALAALVEPLRPRVASIEARLIRAKDASAVILEAANRWSAELLIKPLAKHHPAAEFLHTPLDWSLMRHAPCAVLLAKGDDSDPSGPVLAAVDIADKQHSALNREILRRAARLAETLGVALHAVTAYPDLGQTGGELQVADDFDGIKADMRDSRRRGLSALLDELGVRVTELHLLEGRPVQVIPALGGRLRPSLTVLGTAARRGIAKLLIGNTAEDLIGRIEGDLMTVREPWS
jgi:universal stress protein E